MTEMDRGATREGGRGGKERGGGLDRQTGAWMTQLVRKKDRLGKGKTVRGECDMLTLSDRETDTGEESERERERGKEL